MNRGLKLDEAQRGIRPAVQTADDWQRMHFASLRLEAESFANRDATLRAYLCHGIPRADAS
jgi:hypothetical protein